MLYTLYHAPEDGHLVRPLARYLELAEVSLVCVDAAPKQFASNALVLCGSGFDNHPWLKGALRADGSVIAVLLANVEPGVKKIRTIDLRSWPARSADKTLVALTEWLKSEGNLPFPGMTAHASAAVNSARRQRIGAFAFTAAFVGLVVLMIRYADQDAGARAVPPESRTTGEPLRVSQVTTASAAEKETRSDSALKDPGLTAQQIPSSSTPPAIRTKFPAVAAHRSAETDSRAYNSPLTTRAELDRCSFILGFAQGTGRMYCPTDTVAKLQDPPIVPELP